MKNFKILALSIFIFISMILLANAGPNDAYIQPANDVMVRVISTGNDSLAANFAAAQGYSSVVSPDGNYVAVCSNAASTVYLVSTSTNTVISTISVDGTPHACCFSPDSTKIYTANAGPYPGSVSVINVANRTKYATVSSVDAGGTPYEIEISPDGSKLYVTTWTRNAIRVISTSTLAVTSINGLNATTGVRFSPDGSKAYVVNNLNSTISVINAATDTVTSTITGFNSPHYLAVTSDGSTAFVSNNGNNTLSKVNLGTGTITSSVGVGASPEGVAITPDQSRVYVVSWSTSSGGYVVWANNNTVKTTFGQNAFSCRSAGFFIRQTSISTPVASFTGTPISGNAPLSVSFTDTSTNTPTSWSWDFGDGYTSTAQNPSHTYNGMGVFTVSLTATNAGGSNTYTRTNYITVGNATSNTGGSGYPFTAAYIYPNTGITPLTASFTNWGSNYSSCLWDFGDGNTSTTANTSHTYYVPGIYNFSLNNSNAAGWNKVTGVNAVQVYSPVTSDFTANRTSIAPGDYILFSDNSAGSPDTWRWCINGAQVSTATNLIYQFPSAGTYSIQHYAYNSLTGSGGWNNKTNYIYVSTTIPVCDFTANVTFGNAPLDILLTDTSTNDPSSFTWGINGVYQTNTQDMSVTFNNPGIYSINHTATNAIGTGSNTKTNYIQVYNYNYGGIYGYVRDAATGNNLTGANLQFSNGSATASYVTSSDGFYYFWPCFNGVYNLSVSKNGYAIADFPNTIINGTTVRQDIYLTSYSDNVNETNVSNYTSDWFNYNLVSDPSSKQITLTYAVTKGTTTYSNCTIYDELAPVYSSNITSQTGTFTFTGSSNKNYLVSFDLMNSEGNRFSGAFPVLFYRGFTSSNPVFPPGTPTGVINGIIVLLVIACFAFFGKAYIEIGMFMGLAVLASSYMWGFLNLPESIHVEVIIFLTALIAGGSYIAKKKIFG